MKIRQALVKQRSGAQIALSIHEAIRNGELKPGDKLCSESVLARKYSGSVYSVRQATRQLKEQGILYSVPKSGVFVNDPGKIGRTVNSPDDGTGLEKTLVRFATRGILAPQKELFRKIGASFEQTSLFCGMTSIYHQAKPSVPFPQADLYEFSNHSVVYQNKETFIDFRRYFSETVRFPDRMKDSAGIPLCYSLPVMLYNKRLLEDLGAGTPDCRNFRTMTEYLDEVTAAIACRGEYVLPGTSQNIIYKLGRVTDEVFKDIRRRNFTEKQFLKKYREIFRFATAYWKKYHICYPNRARQHVNDFIMEKTPFYFGLSADYLKMRSQYPDFPLGAAVMPSCDDTVSGITLVLAVDSESPCLIDAVRLAKHFQKAEFQADLARIGYAPAEKLYYRFLPYDNVSADLQVYDCIGREDFPIAMNILNVELWNTVLFDKPLEEAVRDILIFSRSLLDMKLDHPTLVRQQQWAEIYQ